jgi:hypothetical protein
MSFFGDNTVITGTLGINTGASTVNYPLWVKPTNSYGEDGANVAFSTIGINASWVLSYNGVSKAKSAAGTFSGTQLAIVTEGNIAGNSMFGSFGPSIASDIRIKKNIQQIPDEDGLRVIRMLQPCRYEYIDNIEHSGTNIGFIAQDVMKVFPGAIKFLEKPIPNIFEFASVAADGVTLTLNEKSTGVFSKTGGVVTLEIHDTTNNVLKVDVVRVIDDKSFVISVPVSTEKVFVFGQIVKDFHNISYDYIYTMAVSAVKSLDTIVQKREQKIAAIRRQLDLIKSLKS